MFDAVRCNTSEQSQPCLQLSPALVFLHAGPVPWLPPAEHVSNVVSLIYLYGARRNSEPHSYQLEQLRPSQKQRASHDQACRNDEEHLESSSSAAIWENRNKDRPINGEASLTEN